MKKIFKENTIDFLAEIEKLLGTDQLDPLDVINLYHDVLLENATSAINNHVEDRVMTYVEEFLQNAVYLLELHSEPDARFQLESAKFILTKP